MKRGLLILIAGLIAGLAAYACVFFVCMSSARKLQQSDQPELAWLKEEFKLSDSEFERVSELHQGYLPQCAEMCRRVAAENAKLQKLLSTETNVTPKIEQTLNEVGRLRAECQAKMLRHFYEVSRTMPPEEGRRYLEWVKNKAFISDQDMASAHAEGLHESSHGHIPGHH